MSKCEFSLKVLWVPNFYQITHSCTLEELSHGEVPDLLVISHLLKMSKCELSLKVLQIASISQITHFTYILGELSISEFQIHI